MSLALCSSCGTLRTDWYPTDEQLAQHYAQEYREKDHTGPQRHFARTHRVGEVIARMFPDAQVVYDIGCGTGGALAAWPKAERWGCDLGAAYLEHGQSKLPRANLVVGSECDLPDGKADIVLALHTLEHRTDIRQALANHAQKLSDNGTLVVELPLLSSATFHYRSTEQYLQIPHCWHFTHRTFTNLCRQVGLSCRGTQTGVFFCKAAEPQPITPDHLAAADTLYWLQMAKADEELIAEMDHHEEPRQLGGLNAVAGVRRMRGA